MNRTLWELGEMLGRSLSSIFGMLKVLGLVVPDDVKRKRMLDGFARGWEKGKESRFKKGMVPWNKGLKGLDIGGKDTRFKKGIRWA